MRMAVTSKWANWLVGPRLHEAWTLGHTAGVGGVRAPLCSGASRVRWTQLYLYHLIDMCRQQLRGVHEVLRTAYTRPAEQGHPKTGKGVCTACGPPFTIGSPCGHNPVP